MKSKQLSKHLFFLLLTLIFADSVKTQQFTSRWQYSWGGDRQDFLNVMIPLPGNQYFFAGTAASGISCTKSSILYGDEDFAVMVFDDGGNKLWEKSYGGDRWDQLKSAIKVQSGGYILAGETQSGSSGIKTSANNGVSDFWVVRIDDAGNLIWEKSYGNTDFESATKILATPDGGYLVAGLSLSNQPGYNNGRGDYQLIKIDATGNLLWSKLYGGTEIDELYDLIATSDGNYFLSGTSASPVSGNKTSAPLGQDDIWLVKVDPNGNKIWDKSFGTSAGDYRGRLLPLQDGNTIIVESALNSGRIRKIDNNGNQLWLQTCSGSDQDFFEVATEDISTGNIYVAGTSKTNSVGCKTSPYNGGGWFSDIWIAVFDAAGNKINDLDYGGNDGDIPTDIQVLNNEIWVTAWSDSPLSGNKTTNNCGQTADGWIIRLSNNIYINNHTPTALCRSQQTTKVHFTTAADYNPGNTFTIQLSDINGSFTSPQTVGVKTGTRSDSVVITLPTGILPSPNYKLRVITSSPSDTSSGYPLWIHDLPLFNLGNDTVLCSGTSILLTTGQQPTNSQYRWQDNSQGKTFTVNTAGIYWCEIQNACGTLRDSIVILPKQKPVFSLGNDRSFCTGDTLLLESPLLPPDYTYTWNTGAVTPSISVTTGGLYWLKVANVCGNLTDSITILRHDPPVIHLNQDSVICIGTPRVLTPGNGFAGYIWNTGETTPAITVTTTGLYWVKVTNAQSCSSSDSLVITKIVTPATDFLPAADSVCASYGNLAIAPLRSFPGYLWNNGTTTNTIVVNTAGTYWLTVTDSNSCKSTDSIVVYSKKCLAGLYMPTAFTPNQDGLNDILKPFVGGLVKAYRFTIYNRWGEIVFTSTNPQTGWNGQFNNLMCDTGIFVWTCAFEIDGLAPDFKKGTVLLIR